MSTFTCPGCGAVSYNPNDVEHRYCGRCHTHWRKLGPGVYSNDHGEMHLSIPELLADNNIADTPENRDMIERTTRRLFGDLGITDVEVIE